MVRKYTDRATSGDDRKRDYAKFLAAVLLFGSNGIIASQISLSSERIVMFRTLLGSALLIVILLYLRKGGRLWSWNRDTLLTALSGVATGVSWIFVYAAYRLVGVGIATIICYCGPALVMMLSPIIFREHLTLTRTLSFLTVLIGVFLIDAQALQQGGSTTGLFYSGMSAICYAIALIATKKATHIDGLGRSSLQLLASFVTAALFVLVKDGFAIEMPATGLIWLVVLGLVNTGLGCYLYFSSIAGLPVQTCAVCSYIEPLSAVVLSVLILHEMLAPGQWFGAALILGGAVVGEYLHVREQRIEASKLPPVIEERLQRNTA